MKLISKIKTGKVVLIIGIIMYIVGSLADIYTTISGVQQGYEESNYIVKELIEHIGLVLGVFVSKTIAIPIALYIGYAVGEEGLWKYRPSRNQAIGTVFLVLGIYYLAVGIRNWIIIS